MRKHYFDNGKAIACFLGIIYHTSMVFSSPWIINVNESQYSAIFLIYTDYINLFRMPLFLFISGYFVIYAVKKYKFQDFTLNRFTRLGIPLFSTLLTFYLLEIYFSKVLFYKTHTVTELLSTLFPWNQDFSLSHLWFLYYVIIFSFIIYLFSKFFNWSFVDGLFKKLENYMDVVLISFTILMMGISLLAVNITGINHALISFYTMGIYFPYFLFGVITYTHWEIISKIFIDLSKKRVINLTLLMIISMFLLSVVNDTIPYFDTIIKVIARYTSLILVLVLLNKFLNRTNKFLRYVSDSSYSVYLIHQPIIVVISYYYIEVTNFTNSLVGFLIILIISTLIIYSFDFIIIRNTKIGMFLYTGRKISKLKQKAKIGKEVIYKKSGA